MKKTGNGLWWFIAVIFLLIGLNLLSESFMTGLLIVLFGLSLCQLWKVIPKNYSLKLWMKIVMPIALFTMTACTTSSTPTKQVETPKTIQETQVKETPQTQIFSETEVSETVTVMSEVLKEESLIPTTELTVHFINVGQGDSTLITCGGNAMLIDAGDNNKGTTVQNYLQKQEIKKLDYVIGTHPDSDHIGGLDVVITKFDCGLIMMPDYPKDTATYRDVVDAMKYKGYKNTLPVVGTSYKLGDAEFTIIAPNKEYSDPNNSSVGIILTHGEKKFLFTGDAEEEAEADIVSNGVDISCDVYQVGHHGSNTSSSIALLEAANPTYAVISCEEGNKYGHPRAETLINFRTRGIKVYRTDEQGTIIAKSDGHTISFEESPSDTWIAGEPKGNSSKNTSSLNQTLKTNEETIQETEAVQGIQVTYILNTSSKKFHYSTCSSLPTKNRKDTNTSRDEIISNGYSPCKKCNP